MLRRTLASSRYIVFIAVVATLVASFALILYEAMVVAEVVFDTILSQKSPVAPKMFTLSNGRKLVAEMDITPGSPIPWRP